MRSALAARNGQRLKFRAVVDHYGWKDNWHGYPIQTVMLRDVIFASDDLEACDHLWFTCGKWARMLSPGATIEFEARIDAYEKGFQGGRAERLGLAWSEIDFHLERPTKVTILSRIPPAVSAVAA